MTSRPQGVSLTKEDIASNIEVIGSRLAPHLGLDFFQVQLTPLAADFKDMQPLERQALEEDRVIHEPRAGRLFMPVVHEGRPLALITATLPKGRNMPTEALPLFKAIISLGCENILLNKARTRDVETGLMNAAAFSEGMRQAFFGLAGSARHQQPLRMNLEPKRERSPLALLLVQVEDFEALTHAHGRLVASQVMKALAARLADLCPGGALAGRLAPGGLGMFFSAIEDGQAEELAQAISQPLDTFHGQPLPVFKLFLGLSLFPQDFGDAANLGLRHRGELAELMISRAELAAARSGRFPGQTLTRYADVLAASGRVIQRLSPNQAAVDIGRAAGAREGQVFSLMGAVSGAEPAFKGQVVLTEVQDDFSKGAFINLKDSFCRPSAGDQLIYYAASLAAAGLKARPGGQSQDPMLDLPDHWGFKQALDERLEGLESFAILLVRLDNYEGFRLSRGRLASDEVLKSVFELIRPLPGEEALWGRYSAECLAVLVPGLGEEEVRDLAGRLIAEVDLHAPQTVSVGAARWPQLELYAKADTLDNARKALDHAWYYGPSSLAVFDAVSLNVSGDNYFDAGDYENAVEEYKKALLIDFQDTNVINSLGVTYGLMGQLDLALDCFDQVLRLEPEDAMALFNKGLGLLRTGREEEAHGCLGRAAQKDPASFEALFHLGKLSLKMGRAHEAVGQFERAAALPEARPVVQRYLGQALTAAGREREAIEAFRAAVRHNPRDAQSLSDLSVLFLEVKGEEEVARTLARSACDLDPGAGLNFQRLGLACLASGCHAEAEKAFEEALELGENTREVWLNLGLAQREQGRLSQAMQSFDQALALDPDYRPAQAARRELEGRPS